VRAEIDAAQHADDDVHAGDDTGKFAICVGLRFEVEVCRSRRTRLRGGDGHRGEWDIEAYRFDSYVAQQNIAGTVQQ
jgi:hypothetical protein